MINRRSPRRIWGLLVGAVTGLLLYVGGLNALQAASIVFGLPIGFIVVAIGIGLLKGMREMTETSETSWNRRG